MDSIDSNIDYKKRMTDDISLSPNSSSSTHTLPTSVSLSPTSSTSLSAMLVITYSKEFAVECYNIITSKEYTLTQKIITIIRLLNNIMNMEQFFYLDLIITLFLSLYSFFITRNVANNSQYIVQSKPAVEYDYNIYPSMPSGIQFYFYGNLIVNSYFLFYFSYCRFLNGKDIITLRRSIQLLSHCFQISSIGLLILCKERNNHIADLELVGSDRPYDTNYIQVYGQVTFVCTANILTTYSFRVLWHSIILIKTLIDEYLSNFVISRGTLIDLLMILIIPIGSFFSYLSNYHAKDCMRDMMRKLSVTYELNNISRLTEYYDQLTDSCHSKAVNVMIFCMFFVCFFSLQWFMVIWLTCIVTIYALMIEYFLCGKNKYGNTITALLIILLSIGIGIRGLLFTKRVKFYYYNIPSFEISVVLLYCALVFAALVFAVLLVLFTYQNRSHVALSSIPFMIAKSLSLGVYIFIYCPLHPLVSYICGIKSGSTSSESGSKEASEIKDIDDNMSINRIEENHHDHEMSATNNKSYLVLTITKVLVLTLLSPVVDYYFENVEVDLKILYSTTWSTSIPNAYTKFTISHHGSYYNVMVWIIVNYIISQIIAIHIVLRILHHDLEDLESPTYAQTLSPSFSPTSAVSPTLVPTYSPTTSISTDIIEHISRSKIALWCLLGNIHTSI